MTYAYVARRPPARCGVAGPVVVVGLAK
jgi:hypothetical protein